MTSLLDKGEWIKGIAHWREGDTAYISIAFSWRLLEGRRWAEYYRSVGCSRVIAGGPGAWTHVGRKVLRDVAEVPSIDGPGGRIPDTIARHNPMATRASYGCPVDCSFCIVSKMDGKTFTLLPDFPVRPVLCDDNLSALSLDYQKHIVARYIATDTPMLDCNSGFEPKTFDDEVFALWKPIIKGPWRFGFDEKTEGAEVRRVFKMLKDVSPRKKQVYTMIGHEPFEVCMDRIMSVIWHGGEPYAQPYMKLVALTKDPAIMHDWTPLLLKQVQRYVNRHLWRGTGGAIRPFSEYNASAKTNPRPRKSA